VVAAVWGCLQPCSGLVFQCLEVVSVSRFAICYGFVDPVSFDVVLTPSGVVTVAAGVFSAAADHFPPLKVLLLKVSSTVMSISSL
jgi:hypothetical protein